MTEPSVSKQGLAGLLARVEKAEGPDREIDCLIYEWQNPKLTPDMRGMYYGEPSGEYFTLEGSWRAITYTASLDAALALCERVLPGWVVMNLCEWEDDKLRAQGPWMGQLKERGVLSERPNPATCMHAATPALALLAAMLRALIAQSSILEEG